MLMKIPIGRKPQQPSRSAQLNHIHVSSMGVRYKLKIENNSTIMVLTCFNKLAF